VDFRFSIVGIGSPPIEWAPSIAMPAISEAARTPTSDRPTPFPWLEAPCGAHQRVRCIYSLRVRE